MSLLEIKDLHTYFDTRSGYIKAVDGVSLSVDVGKTLGVIGESGSGKSQTAMSVLRLFEKNQRIHKGEILFDGEDIASLDDRELRRIRGNTISMIFQEPMTSLNPVFTVERQISESLILHRGMNKNEARAVAVEMLKSVQIPNAEGMVRRYPHELSGGMRQRVMIAIALACRPKLLIADEPTTALDVTIQAQILRLINELKTSNNTAVMFITHDLAVVRQMADDVAVMYCGQVVEFAPSNSVFDVESRFAHPYTRALLESLPTGASYKENRLEAIPGTVPHPLQLPSGCKFSPRCKYAVDRCKKEEPELMCVDGKHSVRCFYPDRTKCKAENEFSTQL